MQVGAFLPFDAQVAEGQQKSALVQVQVGYTHNMQLKPPLITLMAVGVANAVIKVTCTRGCIIDCC